METKRQLQKAATRKLILDTAYQVYAEQGFTATTNKIAQAANVSHGTIFVHFPTVENLISCLLEEFGIEINEQLHSLSEQDENLETFLDAHITILIRYEKFYQRLISEISLLPEQARFIYINMQSVVSFHLNNVLIRYQTKNLIKDIPMHLIFNTWLGLLHYYLSNSFIFTTGSVLTEFKDELISNYIKLIKK
ncbi:TetR/AcrR family transcriptional regulator [Acetobacterium woodii]|uniref:Transcriptional regulator TetR family n=1 Tax=Acetobacterium woodii (strain ATCC 29683 / DSM 1030 / JCM 2381 / KCTC 1655 / WB1) TaxID=931626 RepID=H6LHE2_ACEWD|nr:TetR/AcrR family transcriptional regulator [Acetobacterium woodii]AFA49652.1 transcriptional regulator TetR family [Acetobacterium woodii DSM 1030]